MSWSDDDIEAYESTYCDECGERDVVEALSPVYVATREWHRVEKMVHPECRELFVSANLDAVLASLRLVSL